MRSLLIACVLIALAAVAAPRLLTYYLKETGGGTSVNVAADTPSDAAADTSSDAAADDSAAPAANSRQVSIRAERDGHFYVDAEINFRPVRLMVDTGATVVALRASDAAAAGLNVRQQDFTNPVQTANGQTMAAETEIDSVNVEDIEVRHIRALVLPDDQLSISLLGGSFLKGLQRYQVEDGTLIFEN